MLTEEEWRLMAEAMGELITYDYPAQMKLADIIQTWGNATERQLAAIRKYEASL